MQRNLSQQNQSNQQNSSKNFESLDQNVVVVTNNTSTSRWNAIDVKFFDFFYDDKSMHIDKSIIHFVKNIYFRDVYIFIDKVNDLIIVKSFESIRENLWIYLKNTILTWWINELIDNEKRMTKLIVDTNDKLSE